MKILAYFIIVLNIFSLSGQEDINLKKQVLEYIVNSYVSHEGPIYLQYGGNELLKHYLDKNKITSDQDLSFHHLRQFLSEDDIYTILNEEEVTNFRKQLEGPIKEIIYTIEIKNPSVGYTPLLEVKQNFKTGATLNTGIYYLVVSEPIISSDNKQVLVNISQGIAGSYSGGIILFQVDEKSIIRPKANLDPWIE
jgi:hypothetical protein